MTTSSVAAPSRVATLTTRVSRAVAVYETNRGGDAPRAVESSLQTVAGVKASLRTVGQHIVSRAVTDLLRYPALRRLADPDLTAGELQQADARLRAVVAVLRDVPAAARARTAVPQFVEDQGDTLTTAGLTTADVARMMSAVDLRAVVVRAHDGVETRLPAIRTAARAELAAEHPSWTDTQLDRETERRVAARRQELVRAAAAAIPVGQRLGLDEGSLRAYVRNPRNWGEHAAGWQRLAVERMPRRIGVRVVQAAEHDDGMPMLEATVRGQVEDLAAPTVRPVRSDEAVVRAVATAHNADPAYPDGVWREYRRLYPDAGRA